VAGLWGAADCVFVRFLFGFNEGVSLPAVHAPLLQVSLADAEKRSRELSWQVKMMADLAGSPGGSAWVLVEWMQSCAGRQVETEVLVACRSSRLPDLGLPPQLGRCC
jgi:hypothetical protein